jgi:outer membrane protein, heavy metal efflux system
MRFPVLMLLVAATPAMAVELTLETVLAAARPSPERLAADRFLAQAARELSLSRGIVLDGLELTAEAGPRRSPESDGSDFAVGVELPLAGDRGEREAALDLFAEAERLLPAAADLEAGLALRLAYVDVWEATEALELARRQVSGAEEWLRMVAARVAAGAEAPYESSLVAAELGLARLALAEAREQEQVAWSELRARSEVGAEPAGLVGPGPATLRPPGSPRGDVDGDGSAGESVLVRAIEVRSALEQALLQLDAARGASRWSLLATAAQEGEEDVARLGVGYRLPFGGQTVARETARDAALAEERRGAELERARLDGRWRGAEARASELAGEVALSPQEIEAALAALEARVTTGRDRPSAVLPLRRQLIGALVTELAARAAQARAVFLIQTLKAEMAP